MQMSGMISNLQNVELRGINWDRIEDTSTSTRRTDSPCGGFMLSQARHSHVISASDKSHVARV
jgi:hypothetical protein